MKLEKITDKKFRVIVHVKELEEKNIKLDSFFNDLNSVHKLISCILRNVNKKINISLEDSNFIVDFLVFEKEFIVLNFTKISLKNLEVIKHSSFKAKSLLYQFANFDDFCKFASYMTKLINLTDLPKDILLYEYQSFYYLYIPNFSYDISNLFLLSILEFAKLVNNDNIINYKLFEYGNIIFKKNALTEYSKHFK